MAFWTDIYRQHFQKHFGKPFDIQVYHDSDDYALKLATHDLAMQGFRVYSSLGMADMLARDQAQDFGEVILYADAPDPEVPMLFVNALFFILHNDIPLGSRFSIGGIDDMQPAFFGRYHKSVLYFSRPFGNDKTLNEVSTDDATGRVVQAYFVTPEEDRYLDEFGADVFEREFAKQFEEETEDDLIDLLVDKSRHAEAEKRILEVTARKAQRTAQALSLRRKSCV